MRYRLRLRAGPDGISHLATFDSAGSRFMPLHELDTCLTGLKQQGISVSRGAVGESDSTFEVMGIHADCGANNRATPERTNGRDRDKGVAKSIK